MAYLWKYLGNFRLTFKPVKSFKEVPVRYISKSLPYFCQVGEEKMEDLQKNPYFEKYAKQIARLKNEDEHTLNKRIEEMQQKKKAPPPPEEKEEKKFVHQSAKPNLQQPVTKKTKKLQDVLKFDLIEDKSPDEISKIWEEYHNKENCLSAVVKNEKYKIIEERSKRFNTFLFPLPRDQGYEFFVCQFQNNECHFTTLLNYQTYKENAPECLTLIHFLELSETKGIILMKGEFHKEIINVIEAQCLINQLQLYYAEDDPKRTKLLETFTMFPDQFKHSELVAELQNIITA